MQMSATTVRRGLYGMFAGGLLGLWIRAAMRRGQRRRMPHHRQLQRKRRSPTTASSVSASARRPTLRRIRRPTRS